MSGKWQRFIFIVFSLVTAFLICFYYEIAENNKTNNQETEIGLNESTAKQEIILIQEKGEENFKKNLLGEFLITAYCPCEVCCGEHGKSRPIDEAGKLVVLGSTGTRLEQGVSIAVDPEVIPYGSIVEIGEEKYVAQDCGGAIQGNRIDIYFESHEEALNFGIKWINVYLVETEA